MVGAGPGSTPHGLLTLQRAGSVSGAQNAREEPACAAHTLAFPKKKRLDASDDDGPAEVGAFDVQADYDCVARRARTAASALRT